jgi:Ca-activated chloride channel homolog
MQFLTPTALWFAAVIPVVVLLYLLKRKRVVRLVSSTVLWQRYIADAQASAPFQKLRRNWLLLLQILVVLLAVLALARPFFTGELSGSRLYVVVLDASASMQSIDETPSRFERARVAALRLVDSLRDSDQMIVLEAGAHAAVRQSTTGNKAALRRAIEGCEASDSTTRLTEALKMAASLTRDNDEAEVHLFSDGAAGDLVELQNLGLRLVYHRVGHRAMNLGITRLEARSLPENPEACAVFTTVANVSPEARETQVELRFNGQLVDSRLITVQGTNAVSLAFRAAQPGDGVFTVRLSESDDLAVDNEASVVWRLPRPVRVLLVTRGNRYLERALRAVGGTELEVVSDVVEARPAVEVVVLDNVSPAVWPEPNVIAFSTMNPDWFDSGAAVDHPAIVDWRGEHSLLRHVSFDNVHVGRSRVVSTPSWAVSVVDSPQSSLILGGDRGRQRIVWIGFDLWESDWPLRVSFPIFMANAVRWLNPAGAESNPGSIPVGEPIRMALEPGVRTAQVVHPDGSVVTVPLDSEARELVYGRTERQGIYRVRMGTNETLVGVNLLDAAETDVQPRAELDFGRYGEVRATTARAANLEVWRWVVALGLGMMMVEWWYYHRRTA